MVATFFVLEPVVTHPEERGADFRDAAVPDKKELRTALYQMLREGTLHCGEEVLVQDPD